MGIAAEEPPSSSELTALVAAAGAVAGLACGHRHVRGEGFNRKVV